MGAPIMLTKLAVCLELPPFHLSFADPHVAYFLPNDEVIKLPLAQ